MESHLTRLAAVLLITLSWSVGAQAQSRVPPPKSTTPAQPAPGTVFDALPSTTAIQKEFQNFQPPARSGTVQPQVAGGGPAAGGFSPGSDHRFILGNGSPVIGGLVPGPNAVPANPQPPAAGTIQPFVQGTNAQPAANAQSFGAQVPATTAPVAVQPVTGAPDPSLLVMGIVYNGSDNSDVQICSGTLVDPTHLLTAGHCACGNPTSYRIYPTYSIYPPGNTNIKQAGLNTNYYRSKVPVAFDPRLCGGGRINGNDLALLELAELSVPISSMNFGAPPYTLLHELTKGEKLSVVGYGYNNDNTIGFRYKDKIPIMSVACTERIWAPYCASFAEMVLGEGPGAGQRDDTCGGDSGGPVFQSSDFGYALLAVTSRAAPGIQDATGKNCGGGGIYTLAGRDSVQQWLKANGVQPAPWLKIGAQ